MSPATNGNGKSNDRRGAARAGRVWLGSLTVLVLCAASSFFLHLSTAYSASPKLATASQVTHDGLAKSGVFSDGSNLYVTEWAAGRQVISKIVPGTGEHSIVATPFTETKAVDMSPDRLRLLALPVHAGARSQELWDIPLGSAAPQRVGQIAGDDAAWSPDGETLVFAKKFDLYIASRTGSKISKLATLSGRPFSPRFSPDGNRIRFTVGDVETNTSSLWEMGKDGSNPHELLPGWSKPQRQCCGVWTSDGHYYIFQASQSSPTTITTLWALDESETKTKNIPAPIRLTDGPMSFGNPWPAQESNRIWALGVQPEGEAVKYDAAHNSFSKLLAGISATDLDFSPDGKWVSYVTIPDGELWRSHPDGSDRLKLTSAPDRAALPRWSPDSKRIAYVGVRSGSSVQIMLVSVVGGKPAPALVESRGQIDANWSADGAKMLFADVYGAPTMQIRLLDLKTHAVSAIPGSEGLFSPRWSPDGRYIVALTPDFTKVMLFDFQTQKWTNWLTEAAGAVNYPIWSADSKYLYFDDLVTDEESIRRVKVGETQPEAVFVLRGIDRYQGAFGLWSGRAPDGSWMFVRDRSTQEVYSLNIELSK
jgi:Tol biopolymer transport system component